MDLATQVREKLVSLQDALNASTPRLPVLLKEILDLTKQDPEQVTLLSEEEINILVSGLKRQTALELSTATVKNKTKPVKSIGMMDL